MSVYAIKWIIPVMTNNDIPHDEKFWLKDFDNESAVWTQDVKQAMRFDFYQDAAVGAHYMQKERGGTLYVRELILDAEHDQIVDMVAKCFQRKEG